MSLVCVETTPADDNCTTEWFRDKRYNRRFAPDGKHHFSASTLVECQKACEFDPRCGVVDWEPPYSRCYINIKPNHTHFNSSHQFEHYELVSRCNVTSGQCSENTLLLFFDSVYLNMMDTQNFSNRFTADYEDNDSASA